jgi:ferrochelatase
MRYGQPNLDKALNTLSHCEHLTILPLYPQYSSAATGSSLVKTLKILSQQNAIPSIKLIRDFHEDSKFLKAQAELIEPHIAHHDFILFSYHGVPENHLLQGQCKVLCAQNCSQKSDLYKSCYRSQCAHTTELLAHILKLQPQQHGFSFQSRLGRTPWIEPYTDKFMIELASRGIKRLAIACPSFVADCLETLEEIGIRARAQWQKLGGEKFTLIPSLNSSDAWVEAAFNLVQDN